MYQVIDREILLSFNEMRILLYNMGFKSVRGILMPREEFRREEIIRSMHHMMQAVWTKRRYRKKTRTRK